MPGSDAEPRPADLPRPTFADAADAVLHDVALAQKGDAAAFARLVARHQGEVARQMWRFTRDPRQHEELVQEVFVAAWLSLDRYRGRGPFLHWLRKIAARTGMAFWRAEQRPAPLDNAALSRLADDPANADASEAAELVHRALAMLPPRDRAVLTLLHLEEMSVQEAADLLGWSRTMVKVQAWRARKKLKKLLGGAGGV